jgi:histidyl-tRNA synthetase
MALIEPRTLRGFRDYLPALMIPREHLLEKARQVYRSYGYAPIDTPALEYLEILQGKGGAESDKLIYRFRDHGDREVGLRFDLTVPLARFAAQHIGKLGTPFKRYHMGPVWRGENTGHGRYREFWQCDFDTIGTESNAADIETILVINDLFTALGFERFEIRVNNRMVLNGFLETLVLAGLAGVAVLRAIDKLAKIGPEAVRGEMIEQGRINANQADRILEIVQVKGTNQEILDYADGLGLVNQKSREGVRRLRELLKVVHTAGVSEDRVKVDLSIARGLDYYTGTIFETFLLDKPDIGSVCSGGRYDDLAGVYTRQRLPGVGASLGLDRLLSAMEEMDLLPKTATPAPVLIVQFGPEFLGEYQKMGRRLRAEGIGVEVYPEPKKLGPQFKYADQRGFKVALIAGENEFAQGVWKLKDLAQQQETTVPAAEVAAAIRRIVG